MGWINFAPSCAGCDGVTVYGDHLEGYAWGKNIGWIHFKGTAADLTNYKVVARLFRIYLPVVSK